jgi:hypothetical protein
MSKQAKKQKKLARQAELASRPTGMMAAANWPIYEVLLTPEWEEDSTQLVSILVARLAPTGEKVAIAYLLVDLACLGIKNAQVRRFGSLAEYDEFRSHVMSTRSMVHGTLDLVAKILYTARDYAASLGFQPDYVFHQAEPLLSGAQPERCSTPIPTGGPGGKPLYINGPYDDSDQIIATLRRTVGDGNFQCLLQMGAGGDSDFDDSEF